MSQIKQFLYEWGVGTISVKSKLTPMPLRTYCSAAPLSRQDGETQTEMKLQSGSPGHRLWNKISQIHVCPRFIVDQVDHLQDVSLEARFHPAWMSRFACKKALHRSSPVVGHWGPVMPLHLQDLDITVMYILNKINIKSPLPLSNVSLEQIE